MLDIQKSHRGNALLCAAVVLLSAGWEHAVHAQASVPQSPSPSTKTTAAPTFRLIDGVPYRTVGNQTLACDLYIPEGQGPFPVALLLHGGGWRGGDRKQLRRQAAFLAERGFFGMAIDYRLAPAYPSPASFDDSRAAVAWLREHAAQYHLDAAHIAAIGSSAGGNLAAMLGVSSGPHSDAGEAVDAVVAFNGIFDLKAMPPSTMVSDFIGKPCSVALQQCKQASPISFVQSGLPPFLILHGTADKTAPYSQATAMVAALQAAHDNAQLFTAEGAPHTFWIQPRWTESSFEAMDNFLKNVFGRNVTYSRDH